MLTGCSKMSIILKREMKVIVLTQDNEKANRHVHIHQQYTFLKKI